MIWGLKKESRITSYHVEGQPITSFHVKLRRSYQYESFKIYLFHCNSNTRITWNTFKFLQSSTNKQLLLLTPAMWINAFLAPDLHNPSGLLSYQANSSQTSIQPGYLCGSTAKTWPYLSFEESNLDIRVMIRSRILGPLAPFQRMSLTWLWQTQSRFHTRCLYEWIQLWNP